MLEPSDSQECYDMTLAAFELSNRWHVPVLLRLTTRVCHSKAVVRPEPSGFAALKTCFERDVDGRVLLPAYSRPARYSSSLSRGVKAVEKVKASCFRFIAYLTS